MSSIVKYVTCECCNLQLRTLFFFILSWMCFLGGIAIPWAYLSFKENSNLGLSDTVTITYNKTCDPQKHAINLFNGFCDSGNNDCTAWTDATFWNNVDSVNSQYYTNFKHTLSSTHFGSDEGRWKTTAALVTLTFVFFTLVAVWDLYILFCNKALQQRAAYLTFFVSLLCACFSFASISVSLQTSTLSPIEIYSGSEFVNSWNTYSPMVYGCDGGQYIAGAGAVLQCLGGIFCLLFCFRIFLDIRYSFSLLLFIYLHIITNFFCRYGEVDPEGGLLNSGINDAGSNSTFRISTSNSSNYNPPPAVPEAKKNEFVI